MALSKMRSKTHKATKKRIKVSLGGDTKNGKLQIKRINRSHRLIKKSRERKLKGKRSTVLGSYANKLRVII
jgi:ribosomal protein L35